MILKISENISEETLDKLVNFYNSCDFKKDKKALIYLYSRGGVFDVMEAMIDLINRHYNETILLGYGMLASAGFELFFNVKCEKRLVGFCRGMFHQSSADVRMNESWKPEYKEGKDYKVFAQTCMKESTLSLCERLKFTQREILEIKKGNDLWFQPKRMYEFLEIDKESRG